MAPRWCPSHPEQRRPQSVQVETKPEVSNSAGRIIVTELSVDTNIVLVHMPRGRRTNVLDCSIDHYTIENSTFFMM